MKKTRRAVLAWMLVFACVLTGPGVGVAAASADRREALSAEYEEKVSGEWTKETVPAEKPELLEMKEGLVRIGFTCEQEGVVYTVKQGETIFYPGEDGMYLLVPGEYVLLAECEGYEPLEMPFVAEKGAEEILLEVIFPAAEETTAEEETTEAEEETTEVEESTEAEEETTEAEKTTEAEEETPEAEETTEAE